MHYDVVGSPLKTKVKAKKDRAAMPDELATVEHYRRVKRLSDVGMVPDEFEVNDDLIFAPEDASHGDIVCYEVGFDHLGRSAHMKRRHQLRVTLNSLIKRDRKNWLLKKRQLRENALQRILTSYKHSVKYLYAHIHVDRRAFALAQRQSGQFLCPEAIERLVNAPRNDWSTPGDIQASLGVAKYALDWAFQAQVQGDDLAIEHDPARSFQGSRVKAGWNAVYLRRPTGEVLEPPIGEYKVYERHRYLTAKEITALKKKRGPVYRFCRNAVEADVARWLFAHPYPNRADEKYKVLRGRLEAEERWLNDHIEFHRCEHVATTLREKSPSRSERVRKTCVLQVQRMLGYRTGLVSLDASRHEDAKLETSGWTLRLYSPLVMSSERELSTLVTMHQLVAPEGQETGPSSGTLLSVSAGLWGPRTPMTDQSPSPVDVKVAPKTWQKPMKEIEMSLGPRVDPLADTWPRLENRIGTRVPLLADLQVSHPHPFSLARAVGELKDTRQTLSPAFDFLSWALKYRDSAASDFGPIRISERWYLPYEKYVGHCPLPPKEWAKKLDKLTHTRLSMLPIKAVAGVYLWWKFGVEPVINDVNLLMMDVRYALNSSRTGLISMFSKAGAALYPATLRSSVATGSAHELLERAIESFIVPAEVDTTEVTIHAPVFPSPVSLMSTAGVHPPVVDGMVDLGDAVLGDAVRVSGKQQSVVELPARIPDFAAHFRQLQRRNSLPAFGENEAKYFEHILGHFDTSCFMRVASLRSRCMRGSKVFARFDAETINRELHTAEIGEMIAQLGPHQRAWELTPLSFVVDWFFTTHELAAVLDAVSNKNVHSIPDDGQGIWLAHKLAKLYACQTAREAKVSIGIGRPRDIQVLVKGTKYDWSWPYRYISDREWAGFNGALAENVGADWKHLEMPPGFHSDGIMGEFAPFLEASFTLSHFQYDEVPWNWDGQVSVFRRGRVVSQWSDMLPQLKLKLGEGKMVSLLAILFGVV